MEKRYELRDNGGITYVPLSEIFSFSGDKGNYTIFSIKDSSPVRQSHCVGYHWDRVKNEGMFFRLNKSDVINITHVKRIEDMTVYLTNGADFNVWKEEREALRKLIPSI